ncbi:hypothetical protein NE865_05809 [Phthorimaea operculella]|nr:hypothetical protein NE865_05809 [Phthorimaea operculella]
MFYIPFVLILAASVYGIGQPHYECGENGRFEYCIDDIPGCIVGCHCHPGYYFDTESKICEPNAKMVLEFRRQFSGPSPTRVPDLILPMNEQDLEPTPTTSSTINTADVNAKDSDDLGDWLYNHGTSSSDDSSSGSSSSGSDSSSSSSSAEGEKKDENHHDHKDGEHGHRKILVVNKKKKPPLPSFIFLPNMGTPFFSPIGLAPPPMPMFPMVPVPPMPAPPFMPPPPFPGPPVTPPCVANTSSASEATTQKPEEKKTESPTSASESATESATASSSPSDSSLRKHPGNKKLKKHGRNLKQLRQLQHLKQQQLRKQAEGNSDLENFESPLIPEDSPNLIPDALPAVKPPAGPPKPEEPPTENVDFKYLAQLIHKMDSNNNTAQPPKPNETPIVPSRRYGGNPLDNYYQPPLPPGNSIPTRRNFDNNRHLETLDESYYMNLGHQIATLIRKIDATGEQRFNIEVERQRTSPQPLRGYQPLAQNFDQTPLIMDRGYTPRSYWERSVRSLLQHLQPNNENDLQNNPENSLFNLERRVETIATTTRSLSLNDLENVVYWMDKVNTKFRKTTKHPETTTIINDDNLNVNLLPHLYDRTKHEQNNNEYASKSVLPSQLNQVDNKQVTLNKNNDSETLKHIMIDKDNNLRGVLKQNFQLDSRVNFENNYNAIRHPNKVDTNEEPSLKLKIFLASLAERLLKNPWIGRNHQNATNEITSIVQKLTQMNKRFNRPPLDNSGKLAKILNNADIYRKQLARNPMKILALPRKHSYQSNQMFVDNNKRYLHHKESITMPIRAPARRYGAPAGYSRPSSYFHHELQHYDVF